jgi:NAD(P)-dependent dehydrogenase (short-subunit alcohol dehydrogenase family)
VSLSGRTVLITGGNAGIGKETAIALARLGARVVFTSRDPERGRAALAEIREASGNDGVEVLPLDLGDLASVRAAAAAFRARHDRLHVLVNNAGVAIFGRRRETADGFERMLGVNHLGHFLLTDLLLDLLRASAPARIVNVASDAYLLAPSGLDWDDLQHERSYSGFEVYGHSKLCNLYFTFELARRLAGTGVTVNAVHPGYVATELGRPRPEDRKAVSAGSGKGSDGGAPDLSFLPPPVSPADGARTQVHVASAPELEAVTGRYFVDCAAVEPNDVARDGDAARRLWQISERLVAGGGRGESSDG